MGSISLDVRLGQALELETRTYRFDRVRGDTLTFVVQPGEAVPG